MKTRILRVETPDFVAASTWVKLDDDGFVCCVAEDGSITGTTINTWSEPCAGH